MKSILTTIALLCAALLHSQTTDTTEHKDHFELSFGRSLLFISNSQQVDVRKEAAVVVPTTAILFFAEFRPTRMLRVPAFFALPTESKQFLIDGELTNEKASPTLGVGLTYKLFQFRIDDRSKVEFEAGPLSSFLFDTNKKIIAAPILAGRFRIMRDRNFVMYVGASYSFGLNVLGMLYGTGSVF